MGKTSMSVREMGRMLGLGKTDSYWLVKKNVFEVRDVAGKMRVMIDSFEDWYSSQFHYKKVSGELPGAKWSESTLSVAEAAERLNIRECSVYELLKKKPFETPIIDGRIRIDRTSFEAWFASQTRYPIKHAKEGFDEREKAKAELSDFN